jgi:hypothetical protein
MVSDYGIRPWKKVMRKNLLFLLVIGCVPGLLIGQSPEPEAPTKAREISLKDLAVPSTRGFLKEGTKITNKEELAKAIPDKGAQEAILKMVDLKNDYLVFFSWAGSGGDKIVLEVKKEGAKDVALMNYTGGLTRDLRTHNKLFAVPKKMDFKLVK